MKTGKIKQTNELSILKDRIRQKLIKIEIIISVKREDISSTKILSFCLVPTLIEHTHGHNNR